jgi:methyl coenzyme M reductase subunit C
MKFKILTLVTILEKGGASQRGRDCIVNVFHSFPDREITCPPCFFTYYCQHAKLNIS